MVKSKIKLLQLFVLLLFIIAPFVMSFENSDRAELISARILPSYISDFSSIFRWGLLGVLLIIGVVYLQKKRFISISKPVYFFSLFYFIQFCVALVDGVDFFRFLIMTILCLVIPPIIGYTIGRNLNIVKYFVYCISFFLLLSFLLNGHLIFIGQRFFGFLNNPNTFGISVIFWLVILILAGKFHLIRRSIYYVIYIVAVFCIFFSGSRNALLGLFLIVGIDNYNKLKTILLFSLSIIILFIVSDYFLNLSYFLDRFTNISNSLSDSGRMEVWERALPAVKSNLWWGNGMDANNVIADTGNMHNSYLRFVLNMGLVFTILALSMYFASVYTSFRRRSLIPLVLAGFLMVYAVMNVGEDFFVGLGSSVFIYLLVIYGFINYYVTEKNAVIR